MIIDPELYGQKMVYYRAVLSQEGRPLAFRSKALSPHNSKINLCMKGTNVQKCKNGSSICWAIISLLLHIQFLQDQRLLTGDQLRRATNLIGYDTDP